MPERIFVPGEEPDELPEYQSPELITRLVARAKPGDIAHIVPQGAKLEYLLRHLGMNQIHGCVDDRSSRRAMTLWSTYFTFNRNALHSEEARTYTPDDIRLIEVAKAEEYILQASDGRFAYLAEATVRLPSGLHLIKVDSYFNGIISGKDSNGERITGGASFFTPR